MPFANNNGVKIYYEVEGQGPPLVLAHGRWRDLSDWRKSGYTDALRNDFSLILFDVRGHGKSDKPHKTSDYGSNMANDVTAVLDDLGIGKASFFGYSLGAAIGWWSAIRFNNRFSSLILGGLSPYGLSDAQIKQWVGSIEGLRKRLVDPEAAMKGREQSLGRHLTPEERNEFLSADIEAQIALSASAPEWTFNDRDLAGVSQPCLLYCGDRDPFHTGAKEGANHIPQARFVSLPGLEHGPVFFRSDLVLPHVKEFLAEVSKM